MPFRGPLEWDRRFGEVRPTLGGVALDYFPESIRWTHTPDQVLLAMGDGSTVHQTHLVGPDAPIGRSPLAASFELVLGSWQDFQTLKALESAGPTAWIPGWWHLDQWSIPFGGPGRTTWRTSRRLAEGFPVPPEAALDGVPLVATTDPPALGQVRLPVANDSTTHNAEVITAPLAGQALTFTYPAEYQVVATRVDFANPAPNELRAVVDLQEHLPGRYTPFEVAP